MLWSLLTNPTFLLESIAYAVNGIALFGLVPFIPKYFQEVFGLSAGASTQLVGIILVPSALFGVFLGGYIVKRLNLTRTRILFFLIITQSLSLPFQSFFSLSCETTPYTGINTPSSSSLTLECNAGCSCSTLGSSLSPVCGTDGAMYLSPCLAGCTTMANNTHYTGCACSPEAGGGATVGRCASNCAHNLVPTIVLMVSVAPDNLKLTM